MITAIERVAGNNPGGNISLKFTPKYAILNFPDPVDSELLVPVTLTPGRSWLSFDFIENKLSYDELETSDANGPIWQVSIKGVTRGDSPARRKSLAHMVNTGEFVVMIRDNAKQWRIVGNPEQPLQFSYKYSTSDSMPGLRAYSFEFAGSFSAEPSFLVV